MQKDSLNDLIKSAQMAIGVEGALYQILNKRNLSFDFYKHLDKGINFLQEAEDGEKIISGKKLEKDFFGTLFPLQISIEIYLKAKPCAEYSEIVDSLDLYKRLLAKIKDKKEILREEINIAKEAHTFFNLLEGKFLSELDI
jgi:hypothetical protein